MGTIGVASSMAGKSQSQVQNFRPQKALAVQQEGCYGLSRGSYYGNSVVGIRRSRLETGRSRSFVVRARQDEKDQRGGDKVDGKSLESWATSARRANMTSRIFLAAFVWISLFFGISVADNDVSGGRPGRRGVRK